ncbi:MAG: hypothetical protein JSS28_04180 [Proteobacteria bacterium]|nr:hypothetical protein [Pseudomonadota bacterium]
MKRHARMLLLIAVAMTPLFATGCVYYPARVYPARVYYPAAVWVPAHWSGSVWVGGRWR